jgi:hypothetical protein
LDIIFKFKNLKIPWLNSTYTKYGVAYSKESFMANQTTNFQIMFCGKNTALKIKAKRYKF